MTVRNNLSWSEATEQKAQEIIAARKLDGMTDLVKTLVREEWDRRKDEINSTHLKNFGQTETKRARENIRRKPDA